MARKLLVAIIGLASLFSLLSSILNVFGSNAVAVVQHINNFRASANFVYNGTVPDLSLYEFATRLMIPVEDSDAAAENQENRSNQTVNVTLSSKSQFHERPSASTTFTPQTTLMHQSISHNITEATKPNNFDSLRVHCEDRLCSEHLSTADQRYYKICQSITKSQPDSMNPQCHFMDGKGRDPVALVSVPGSGNTWIRSLLERATGICTGSIYCDRPLRTGGYLAESIRGGSVLVVKTHTSDFQWKGSKIEKRTHDDPLYGSAILLIRNPFDTFVAERNRLITLKLRGGRADSGIYHGVPLDDSHTHSVGKEYFSNTSGWDKFIRGIGIRWKKTIDKWFLHPADHPIMVVRYEDLKRNKTTEVKRMLDFLNIFYQEEIVQRLELGEENEAFHRHSSVFEHYTVEQKKSVNSLLQATIELLQPHHVDHLFKLHEYIADII